MLHKIKRLWHHISSEMREWSWLHWAWEGALSVLLTGLYLGFAPIVASSNGMTIVSAIMVFFGSFALAGCSMALIRRSTRERRARCPDDWLHRLPHDDWGVVDIFPCVARDAGLAHHGDGEHRTWTLHVAFRLFNGSVMSVKPMTIAGIPAIYLPHGNQLVPLRRATDIRYTNLLIAHGEYFTVSFLMEITSDQAERINEIVRAHKATGSPLGELRFAQVYLIVEDANHHGRARGIQLPNIEPQFLRGDGPVSSA